MYRYPYLNSPTHSVGFNVFNYRLAISFALSAKNYPLVNYLLDKNLSLKKNENNILNQAIILGNVDYVKRIIEMGADVNSGDAPHQTSPLLIAVRLCNPQMVRLLLENGASVSIKGTSNRSLLFEILKDIKENKTDWFDYGHKSSCDQIMSYLNKYNKK